LRRLRLAGRKIAAVVSFFVGDGGKENEKVGIREDGRIAVTRSIKGTWEWRYETFHISGFFLGIYLLKQRRLFTILYTNS